MDNTISMQGSVTVSRNVTVGGDTTVNGKATFGGNVNVKGWLNAPNIRGAAKGLFPTVDKLNATYSTPHNGWYALVGDALPADLYVAYGGEWQPTGKQAGDVELEVNEITELMEGLKNEILDRKDGDDNLMEYIKGTHTNSSAYQHAFIRIDDFAKGYEGDEDKNTKKLEAFNAWLDGIMFTSDADASKHHGRCKLSCDSVNIEAFNYVVSYADDQGLQILQGPVTIKDDKTIELAYGKYDVLCRAKISGSWRAWQKLHQEELSAEATRAKAAEEGLQSSITAEATRAQQAEEGLQSSITAEATRAKAAEEGLQSSIDDIQGDYVTADDMNEAVQEVKGFAQDNTESITALQTDLAAVKTTANTANSNATAAAKAAKAADKVVALKGFVAAYSDLPRPTTLQSGKYFVEADAKIYDVEYSPGGGTYSSESPSAEKLYINLATNKVYRYKANEIQIVGGVDGSMVELCATDLTKYATTEALESTVAAEATARKEADKALQEKVYSPIVFDGIISVAEPEDGIYLDDTAPSDTVCYYYYNTDWVKNETFAPFVAYDPDTAQYYLGGGGKGNLQDELDKLYIDASTKALYFFDESADGIIRRLSSLRHKLEDPYTETPVDDSSVLEWFTSGTISVDSRIEVQAARIMDLDTVNRLCTVRLSLYVGGEPDVCAYVVVSSSTYAHTQLGRSGKAAMVLSIPYDEKGKPDFLTAPQITLGS